MFARGIVFSILITLFLSRTKDCFAQQATAEFMSELLPVELQTGERVDDGIQNILLAGDRLYIVNVWAGLQVADVSDVMKPKETGNYFTDQRSHNVFVENNKAYLSTELAGVIILDISNPADIRKISSIVTQNGAYWVVARFPYVYVAEGQEGVNIYDISNPDSARLVSTVQTKGWAWGLTLKEDYLYAAVKSEGMLIIDVSVPSAPSVTGRFRGIDHARSVQLEDGVAYVACGPNGLWIIDVKDPQRPREISHIDVGGYVFGAHKAGNAVFLANEMQKRLNIINVEDIRNPKYVGWYQASGRVYAPFKKDVYVYVAADDRTLILRHNYPPVLAPIDPQTVNENEQLVVQARGQDPDGDAIFYSIKNLPQGAAFDSTTGVMSWTPTYEQSGSYPGIGLVVTERTASKLHDSTSFTITVNHVNRNPEIAEIPDYTVDENQTLSFTIPEGSDPDREDQGLLTYSASNLPAGAQFDVDSRTFEWTPSFEQSGLYTIDFAVHDPAGGIVLEPSTITVQHVDRKPVLQPVGPFTIREDSLLMFTLSGNDPDSEDQNALSYKAENLPAGAAFDAQNATFSWKPSYTQSGTYDNILFIFQAGALSDSTRASIRVDHVNRPPILEDLAAQTIDENKMLKVRIRGSDPDSEDQGRLVISASNLPAGAQFDPDSGLFRWVPDFEQSGVYDNISFRIKDPAGLSDTKTMAVTVNHFNRPPVLAALESRAIDENSQLTFSLNGSDPDKEDQNILEYRAENLPEGALLTGRQFSWTPTFDQSGTYPVTFYVSDGRLEDGQTIEITVHHVNRPPVLATVEAQNVDENSELTFSVSGSDPDVEDSGKLSLSAAGLPDGATFDESSGLFGWTPNFEQSGSYEITFFERDPAGLSDTLTVPVMVRHVNRPPVFPQQPAQSVDENQLLSFNLIAARDPDREDEGKLEYSALNLPPGAVFDKASLAVTWTPGYDQSGHYNMRFTVSDGEFTEEQGIAVDVHHVNRPPVLTAIPEQVIDENKPWALKIEYTDPDKEDEGQLTLSAANLPQGAVFDASSAGIGWTPTFEQSGLYEGISVTVSDSGGLSDTKTFNITVNHVNRPPELQPVEPLTVVENSPLEITLKGSDPDKEDAGKLTYSAVDLPAGASLDAQSGILSWTPGFLQAGTYSIAVQVADPANLTANQTVDITVSDLNRPPQLAPLSDQTVKENEPLVITLEGSDPDTDNRLSYSATNLPQGAVFDTVSHQFNWTPSYEQSGSYSVSFDLSDGKDNVSVTVPVTVENVNRPPVFSDPGSQNVLENSPLSITVQAGDEDEGSILTYWAENLPQGASFDELNQVFSWTPTFEQAGSYTVTFYVSDGEAEVNIEVPIEVENLNRPPSIEPVPAQSTSEKEALAFEIRASDEDTGTNLVFSAENLPANAKFDADNHTFRWQPEYDQAGKYEVTFTVSDGEETVSTSVPIEVVNVNRPPQISGPSFEEVEAGNSVVVEFNGTDPDGDELSYSAENLPSGASIDAASGKVNWTPALDQIGDYTIEVRVSDGEAEASAQAQVRVKEPPSTAPADTTQN